MNHVHNSKSFRFEIRQDRFGRCGLSLHRPLLFSLGVVARDARRSTGNPARPRRLTERPDEERAVGTKRGRAGLPR